MNKLIFKRIIAKILIVSIIFTSLPIAQTNVFATNTGPSVQSKLSVAQKNEIKDWLKDYLKDDLNQIEKYIVDSSDKNEVSYAISMPSLESTNCPQNIGYDSITGMYYYSLKDDDRKCYKSSSIKYFYCLG